MAWNRAHVSYVTLITRIQDFRINELGYDFDDISMYGNVRESPNLFNPFFLACETYQGKLTTVVVLFQVKLVGFELLEGGKLRDVQTGLNNNLHAIYGGVQFGRVAWELGSGLISMWESNGFDLPWNYLFAPENQGLEDALLGYNVYFQGFSGGMLDSGSVGDFF